MIVGDQSTAATNVGIGGGNVVAGAAITATGIIAAGGGFEFTGGSFAAGKLYAQASLGTVLTAKVGSTYDFFLSDTAGNSVAFIPTGTRSFVAAGGIASTSPTTGTFQTVGGAGIGGSIYASGNISAGTGAASALNYLIANGGPSGTGCGSAFAIQNGGTNVLLFGNQSAIIGGAYNASALIQVGASGLSQLAILGTVRVSSSTAASSSITGGFIVGDGSTVATNVGIGDGIIYAGVQVVVKATGGNALFKLDSTGASAQLGITFADNGADKWIFYKNTINQLSLYDAVNTINFVTITGGIITTGIVNVALTTAASSATTGAVVIGNGTAATSVGIGGGNVNAGANISAVTFGATGSFTPNLIGTGGGSAHTYIVRSGLYVKTGKRVDFSIRIALSAKDGTMTGPVSISGLPFANSAGTYLTFASVTFAYMSGLSLTTNYFQVTGYITTSASQIQLMEHGNNLQQGVPPANIGASLDMLFSGTYYTDA